jgi:hypothetical protein
MQSPGNAGWRDLWRTVTPIWAALVASRVLFYALERLRFPHIIPPVTADAIQGVVLWPVAVLGCYLSLRVWTRLGVAWSALTALVTASAFGIVARPAYAIGAWLQPNDAAKMWLESFHSQAPDFWYAWGSNAVEYGALYLSCLAVSLGLLSFRSLMNERVLRARMETAAAQERLRTLRAQLNPHFLFNALNSIVSLGETHSFASQRLITQLSDLLRRTLRASECEQHELAEELAYIEAYLCIQQIRQPQRISWQLHVDEPCLGLPVPSLVLLPLVENAVTHGLRGEASSVDVQVRAQRVRRGLDLIVSNTCVARTVQEREAGCGLGLRNIRERLEVLFGARASLTAHCTLPGRFEARVHIPQAAPQPAPSTDDLLCVL